MKKLIEKLAMAELALIGTHFLAPRPLNTRVRLLVCGMVKTYHTTPHDFEGWGVFRISQPESAELVKSATPVNIAKYLKRLPVFRLYPVRPLRGRTWLAYPADESAFRDRAGSIRPVEVHLVGNGRAFERARCRWDGSNFWFESNDCRSDPKIPERMGEALKNFVEPVALRFSGLTPELRKAYSLVFDNKSDLRVRCSEDRLRQALEMGGGRLDSFVDQGDYWTTHWRTASGKHHTSAVRKSDLTILSAGICLSGEDEKFDLQSLVGVVEGA